MIDLDVRENRVEYVGLFKEPMFALWGEGGTVFKHLFERLQPYHSGLASFTSPGSAPSELAVNVAIGWQSEFRFKFDRIESHLHSFTTEQLDKYPDVLERGSAWLGDYSGGNEVFSSHQFIYRAHAAPIGTTSKDFLLSLGTRHLSSLGADSGTGLLFRGSATHDVTMQLALDHSLRISDGIFVEFQAAMEVSQLQFAKALADLRGSLNSALGELGLRFAPNA